MEFSKHIRGRMDEITGNKTPQSQPIPGRENEMIKNKAGGFVFKIDDMQRVLRFLILGTEGTVYYQSSKELTIENAQNLLKCIKRNGTEVVDLIVRVSDKGLAVRNDAAIFALAAASVFGDEATRKFAYKNLSKVCRIGTHLFQFMNCRKAFKAGTGPGLTKALRRWYDEKDPEQLIYQALKYRQREGWTHRDILRLAHPKADSMSRNNIYRAICMPKEWNKVESPLAEAYVRLQETKNPTIAAALIREYNAPREFVPTELLNELEVWDALLENMPMTAMIRNLGNMSKVGLLKPFSDAARTVSIRLVDKDRIKRARIHPFSVLLATKTYSQGRGIRGKGSWDVVPQIKESLNEAFDLSFGNVEPTNKNYFLGVDVSGSMGWGQGIMSPAEGAAAMALITARIEPNYFIGGFSHHFKDLGISASDSLDSVLKKTRDSNFGGTDTSVAINYARSKKLDVDVFMIYTDCETWAGDQHTVQALNSYRRDFGINTKLGVVSFETTHFTIRDTDNLNSMDFVGLDASLPQAISAFVQGS